MSVLEVILDSCQPNVCLIGKLRACPTTPIQRITVKKTTSTRSVWIGDFACWTPYVTTLTASPRLTPPNGFHHYLNFTASTSSLCSESCDKAPSALRQSSMTTQFLLPMTTVSI